MTKITSKKLALFAILAVMASVFGITQAENIIAQEQPQKPEFAITSYVFNSDEYLAKDGIRSVITVENSDPKIAIDGNNPMITTLEIKHQANTIEASPVTLTIDGVNGIFVPKANVRSEVSDLQIVEEFRDTGRITGSLDLGQFVTYSTNKVVIDNGETVQVQMQITIPQDVLDTLEDESLTFNPGILKVYDDSEQKIAMQNDGSVTVLLGGQN